LLDDRCPPLYIMLEPFVGAECVYSVLHLMCDGPYQIVTGKMLRYAGFPEAHIRKGYIRGNRGKQKQIWVAGKRWLVMTCMVSDVRYGDETSSPSRFAQPTKPHHHNRLPHGAFLLRRPEPNE
jgi:hypothetical protein